MGEQAKTSEISNSTSTVYDWQQSDLLPASSTSCVLNRTVVPLATHTAAVTSRNRAQS